jgi:hypothetical protein
LIVCELTWQFQMERDELPAPQHGIDKTREQEASSRTFSGM